MGSSVFNIVVITLAILAIVFQLIGFISPAWMRFRIGGGDLTGLLGAIGGFGGGGGLNFDNGDNDGVSLGGKWNNYPTSTSDPGIGGGLGNFGNGLGNMMDNVVNQINVEFSFGLLFGCSHAKLMGISETKCSKEVNEIKKLLKIDFTVELVLCLFAVISAAIAAIFLVVFIRSEAGKEKFKALICITGWGFSAVLLFIAVGLAAGYRNRQLSAMSVDYKAPWALVMSGIGAGLSIVVGILVLLRWLKPADSEATGVWNKFTNAVV